MNQENTKPIEPPERGVDVVITHPQPKHRDKEEPNYNQQTDTYHFKRTRKSNPLQLGSYKQKRK